MVTDLGSGRKIFLILYKAMDYVLGYLSLNV